MSFFHPAPIQLTVVIVLGSLLVTGCSNSGDSPTPDNSGSNGQQVIADDAANTSTAGVSTSDNPQSSEEGSTSATTNDNAETNGHSIDSGGNATASSSGDIESDGQAPATDNGGPPASTGGAVEGSTNDATGNTTADSDSNDLTTTRVTFDITVPVYVSNALQVRVSWGDKDMTASWVTDESWTATEDFPTNTESALTVTFYDNNGKLTLGKVETNFKSGAAATETVEITADQFDTESFDDDADGISNLQEVIAGTAPQSADPKPPVQTGTLLPVEVNIELVADKTFRISWERNSAADYYRVLENPDGMSGYMSISDKLDATTDSYDHRVALHKRVNARYIVEACNAGGCTQSVQQLIEGNLIDAIGYFKASNTGDNDEFGSSIGLSADGKTLAISAPYERSNATGVNGDQQNDLAIGSGAVYVFVHSGGQWKQQAYIKASNAEAGDSFGYEISLSADGNTLAVGAPNEASAATGIDGDQTNNTLAFGAGAVYVFVRKAQSWDQQAYIKASNTAEEDRFGESVSVSGSGNTLAVGARLEDGRAPGKIGNEYAGVNSGAVYVYERSNNTWSQHAYIKSLNDNYGRMGSPVRLSGDGNTLAIALYDNSDTSGGVYIERGANFDTFYGAVHVLVRSDDSWQEQAYLTPSSGGNRNVFGQDISLSENGNTMAISSQVSVDVFERIDGAWQEQTLLEPSNAGGWFGRSVSISADGSTIAVGAPYENSASQGLEGYQGFEIAADDSGAAYVFIKGDGSWPQQAYVKASNSLEAFNFGGVVRLSANGDTLAIGARNESNPLSGINVSQTGAALKYKEPGYKAGAVYLY